ncbi:uncharacterized protein LOC111104621 isoform X1 [Crassostrea virginica]
MTSRQFSILVVVLFTLLTPGIAGRSKRFLAGSDMVTPTSSSESGVPIERLCYECTQCKCCPHNELDFACDSLISLNNFEVCEKYICNQTIICSGETCKTTSQTTDKTTTQTTATTAGPSRLVTCNKTLVIEAVAINRPVSDPLASSCTDPAYSSPEALLTNSCGLPVASSWSKGQRVTDACRTNVTLTYLPVSTFLHGHHDTMSGIFLDCTSGGGFKIIAQTCTTTPSVLFINHTHGSTYHAQDFYFVLS